jgi:hypothetical protein
MVNRNKEFIIFTVSSTTTAVSVVVATKSNLKTTDMLYKRFEIFRSGETYRTNPSNFALYCRYSGPQGPGHELIFRFEHFFLTVYT